MNIAIDGPAGAGKSTLAKMLARKLGFIYVDTGALYRAVGLFAVRSEVNPKDAAAVSELLPGIHLDLVHTSEGQRVVLNGEDVSDEIRNPEISMAASAVSALPVVRLFLLELQKNIAAENNVVMDGRDIGTVVLPNAELKIFLTASPEERARRRYEELQEKGIKTDYEQVLCDLKTRDKQDSTRDIAPLKPAPDAVVINTTGFEISQSFQKLFTLAKELVS